MNHFCNTYLSMLWVRPLPLDRLHIVYISVLGVNCVCMATPWRYVVVLLCRSQTPVHIPLLSTVFACLCVCHSCLCVLGVLSRVTWRVHRM